MNLFIKLAVRNVHRNMKSTLLNGLGISLTVFVILLVLSLSRGITSQIVSRNIRFETGALSIAIDKKTAGASNKVSGDSLLLSIESALTDKRIGGYVYRIYPHNSVLYLKDNTQLINIKGILPEEISLINEMLKITKGEVRFGQGGKSILISDGISSEYHLQVGDVCNIMLESVDGTINLDEFTITGVFQYTSQMNKNDVYMDYDTAKQLYNCNLPSRILINLENPDDAEPLKKDLKSRFGQCKGLEITSYQDHMGLAKSLSAINKYGMLGLAFFLIMISFVGIWSMQTENIRRRKLEIETLSSFGFTGLSIKKIFLYECLYVSLLFSFAGWLAVRIILLIINYREGIFLGHDASFAFGSAVVDPLLVWQDVAVTFLVAFAYPFVATLISFIHFKN